MIKLKIIGIYIILILAFSSSIYALQATVNANPNSKSNLYYGNSWSSIISITNNNLQCDIQCFALEYNTNQEVGRTSIIPEGQTGTINVNILVDDSPKDGQQIDTILVRCIDSQQAWPCSGQENYPINFETSYMYCGDNLINGNEECDGSNYAGKTCNSLGFDGGTLSCSSDCKLVSSACYKCGDGYVNPGEQCDSGSNNGRVCIPGYDDDCTYCDNSCRAVLVEGPSCGDNKIAPQENCETCSVDVGCNSNEICELSSPRANSKGCATYCGNNICESREGETPDNCPKDCERPIKCGDGRCEGDEGCSSCVQDCGCSKGYDCINGECELNVGVIQSTVKEEIERQDIGKGKLRTIYFIIAIGGVLITGVVKVVFWHKKRKKKKELAKEERKLAAIMFTDMKGYSQEVGKNEEKAIEKLGKYKKIMKDVIKKHSGRVVKTIGDAIMGEFASAVNAVKAAKEIQRELSAGDFLIRIGIHLGDVVYKKGDLLGNGVNIASRIESIAEPGEVYISEDIWKQVKGKVNYEFKDLGLKKLKHIEEEVRVFKVE